MELGGTVCFGAELLIDVEVWRKKYEDFRDMFCVGVRQL